MSGIILTRDQLCAMLNISDTTRQRLERNDPHFPPKVHISLRRVGYFREDALAYLNHQRELATNRQFAA